VIIVAEPNCAARIKIIAHLIAAIYRANGYSAVLFFVTLFLWRYRLFTAF